MARAKHPCPGCATPVQAGTSRCPDCARTHDRSRGSRQQRGYDRTYDQERRRWAPIVATGQVDCARCHTPIPAGAPWDLGHHDQDRSIIVGPEHQACNRATTGR